MTTPATLIQDVRLAADASPQEIMKAMDTILNWVDIKDPQAVDIEAAIVLVAKAIQAMCHSER